MKIQLTDADLNAALSSKLETTEFALVSWRMLSLMEDGRLGFLGDHFKVEALVRQPASAPESEAKKVSLFVKGLPQNEQARNTVVNTGAFKKESLFYKLFAKDMTEAVGRTRGPEFQPFVFPQCHLIKDDCMLLDDLGQCGFKGIDARAGMAIEHVRLVVRALAELHAASLVLEERRGRPLTEQFPEFGFETFFSSDPEHPNQSWHAASIKLCVAIVPHLDKYRTSDAATVARVQAALPPLLQQLFDQMQARAWPGVRQVACHGDVWVNNFMFRDDAQGRPVEAALVDFQLARFMPPAHDLVMMVTFCTDAAFWDAHWDELVRLHWDTMASTLKRAGCDPDKVLPWSEFEDVAKKSWKFGLMQQALEYPFALSPPSFSDNLLADPDKFFHHCHVDRTDSIINVYNEDAIFRRRFNEVMERLIDGYILNQA